AGAKRALLLNMSVASHCELLSPAQIPLKSLMEGMIEDNFEAPVISNVTATGYSTKDKAIELLTEQLIKPVKYKQSILAIADSVDIAIEFGNGATLKGLNKRIAPNLETYTVSDMKSLLEVVEKICNED
ncbi:MAG: malonyl CoA-acyl carrier protein transacylase, partial [Sulfurimonadaceae bacterium]